MQQSRHRTHIRYGIAVIRLYRKVRISFVNTACFRALRVMFQEKVADGLIVVKCRRAERYVHHWSAPIIDDLPDRSVLIPWPDELATWSIFAANYW